MSTESANHGPEIEDMRGPLTQKAARLCDCYEQLDGPAVSDAFRQVLLERFAGGAVPFEGRQVLQEARKRVMPDQIEAARTAGQSPFHSDHDL